MMLQLFVGIAVPLASLVAGLRSTDPLWLCKRPRLLARSLLAVLIVIPLVEVLLLLVLLPDDAVVRAGIVVAILAVGIGPPVLLKRTEAPNDATRYEFGLNIAFATLAIVYLPLAVAIHGWVFHHELSLPWQRVAEVVLSKVLLPFGAGVACARWLPKAARLIERYAPKLVAALILIVIVVALIATWRALLGLGARAWLTCAAAAMVALAIGHAVGGPSRETRVVLADFSAMRFPALALLLASIVPDGELLVPVVLAYVICSALLVGVYRLTLRRRHAPEPAEARP